MDLFHCDRLHYVKTTITNVLNVFRGRPKLKFKNISDIHEHESFCSDNDDVEAVRSSIDVMEEGIVKTEPDVLVSNADDDDDDSFILRLMQIKERCKARKRKRSQDPSTPEDYMKKQKMENDDSDFMETLTSLRTKLSKNMTTKKKRCVKDHPITSQEIVPVDQSEEILDSQEDRPMSSQQIVLVDQSEEILDGQEFSPSTGDSLVEVNFECYENDCFDGPGDCSSLESKEDHRVSSLEIVSVDKSEEILNGQEFSPSSEDSAALVEVNFECPESDFFDRPSDFSGRESKENTEITLEWNLHHELNYKLKDFFYCIPLRMVSPSGMDIVISNSELSGNQSTNFLAVDFVDNTDIPVSSPEVASPKDHDTLLEDCSKDEYAAGTTEVQDKPCSTIEHGLNPDRSLVCRSDDSPEYEKKQSFDSVCNDDIGTQVSSPKVSSHEDLDCAEHKGVLQFTEQTDKNGDAEVLNDITRTQVSNSANKIRVIPPKTSKRSSKLKRIYKFPNSSRKATYAECSTLQNCSKNGDAEVLNDITRTQVSNSANKIRVIPPKPSKRSSKLKRIYKFPNSSHKATYAECSTLQNCSKNGDAEVLNDITRTQVSNSANKIRVIPPKPSKRSSKLKRIYKFPNSSHKATYAECSSLQNCSKSATAFSKQQMHDAKHLAENLSKELKSMKDILDDMLQSEFCLNTSLRDKVNKARMAVKSATIAEEGAKRWLFYMSRDFDRFCKIMILADSSSSSTPQDVDSPPKEVVRKKKKIAFADEAGGKLCQVRFYKEDEGHLSESK